MKRVLFSIITLLALFGGIPFTQADETSPANSKQCDLTFEAEGGGIHFIVGDFQLAGAGLVVCRDAEGNAESLPVRVVLEARALHAFLGIGSMHIRALAVAKGFLGSPNELLGVYKAVEANAALIAGLGAQVAFKASHSDLALKAVISVVHGLGVNVGASSLLVYEEPAL